MLADDEDGAVCTIFWRDWMYYIWFDVLFMCVLIVGADDGLWYLFFEFSCWCCEMLDELICWIDLVGRFCEVVW